MKRTIEELEADLKDARKEEAVRRSDLETLIAEKTMLEVTKKSTKEIKARIGKARARLTSIQLTIEAINRQIGKRERELEKERRAKAAEGRKRETKVDPKTGREYTVFA